MGKLLTYSRKITVDDNDEDNGNNDVLYTYQVITAYNSPFTCYNIKLDVKFYKTTKFLCCKVKVTINVESPSR